MLLKRTYWLVVGVLLSGCAAPGNVEVYLQNITPMPSSLFDTVKQILSLRDREVFTYTLKGKVFTSGLDQRFDKSGEISRSELEPLAGPR